jgi:hypothetical protein
MISNRTKSSSQNFNQQQTSSNRSTLPPNLQTHHVNQTKPEKGNWGCFSVFLIVLFVVPISCILQHFHAGNLLQNSYGIYHHATLREANDRQGSANALKRCACFALEFALETAAG